MVLTRKPWLMRGGMSGQTFLWSTSSVMHGRLWIGTHPENLTIAATTPFQSKEHEIELLGLSPDTRYFYQVGNTSGTFKSEIYSFRSAPEKESNTSVRILCIGDFGKGNQAQISSFEAYREIEDDNFPNLWCWLGDNAYMHGTTEEYQTGVFNVYGSILGASTCIPCFGNHDSYSAFAEIESGPYFSFTRTPKWGEFGGIASQRATYFSLDWANIHFVVLDTAQMLHIEPTRMCRWLKEDLQNCLADFIIVLFHHCPYTGGTHNSDTESELILTRETLLPILEEHGVDLVVSGHSHIYERSHLIYGHYGKSDSFKENLHIVNRGISIGNAQVYHKQMRQRGCLYIVNGAGAEVATEIEKHPAMAETHAQIGSLILEIEGLSLRGYYLNRSGEIIDSFSLNKIKSL